MFCYQYKQLFSIPSHLIGFLAYIATLSDNGTSLVFIYVTYNPKGVRFDHWLLLEGVVFRVYTAYLSKDIKIKLKAQGP